MLFLSLRLARRELRSGGLAIVLLALGLAILATSATYATGVRLESAVLGQASEFLAADQVYQGIERPPGDWSERAKALGLRSALTVEFASMLYTAADRAQLVSVKAVSPGYPLRGHLESALTLGDLAAGSADAQPGPVPAEGNIFLDRRLFQALQLELSESIELANGDFVASRVLVNEPDRASSLGALTPRALIGIDDLEATGAIRPGSRARWRFLLAGDESAIKSFDESLSEADRAAFRVISVRNREGAGSEGTRNALSYIRLSGTLVLLLSMLAGLLAGNRYFRGQRMRIALMKTLGVPGRRLLGLYGLVLLWGAALAIPIGLSLGWLVQWWFGQILSREFDTQTATPPLAVFAFSAFAAGAGLVSSLLPALLAAIRTPPMQLLRTEDQGRSGWLAAAVPAVVIALLLLWAGDGEQVLAVLAVLAAVLLLAAGLSMLLGYIPAGQGWMPLSLARANWRRRRHANTLQIFALALVVFPGATLFGFRAELVDGWESITERQLPNFFLNNVHTDEYRDIEKKLRDLGANGSQFAPLIRGRWTQILKAEGGESGELQRSANISWADQLPQSNTVIEGQWGSDAPSVEGEINISLEEDYAERLGASLGDRLVLLSGGDRLVFRVSSLRQVNWLNLTPNFFALAEPGKLDESQAGWMASFHLPLDRSAELTALLRQYPAVNLFELDALVNEAKDTFDRLISVVNLLLMLLLATATLVLVETLAFDLSERRRQGALMRAFGAPGSALILALGLELAVMGGLSGLAGALGADMLLRMLTTENLEVSLGWLPLVLTGVLSAFLLLLLGLPVFQRTLRTPPSQILRGDFT